MVLVVSGASVGREPWIFLIFLRVDFGHGGIQGAVNSYSWEVCSVSDFLICSWCFYLAYQFKTSFLFTLVVCFYAPVTDCAGNAHLTFCRVAESHHRCTDA